MKFRKSPQMGLLLDDRELLVDNFAGGGGASTGIENALGRPVDIAINHDDTALSVHTVNHPHTRHYCESVWDVDPRAVTDGKPVGLAHFSPDCTHFSKAKGGQPVKKDIRGLAWVANRWAATVKPRIITLENVEEFMTWGPTKDGKPDKSLAGITFKSFVTALQRQGYAVDWRTLKAHHYGAPTIRKRFFLAARRDNQPIIWPAQTHGIAPGLKPVRTVAECINWDIPCPSIFERKRPLADNTLRRIAKGIQKFVIDTPTPFIVNLNHTASYYQHFRGQGLNKPLGTITQIPGTALVTPIIARQFGSGVCHSANEPARTIMAGGGGGKNQLITAFLAKHYTGVTGTDLRKPLGTITTKDHHSLVSAFLVKYYGCSTAQGIDQPLDTVTTRERFGLITIHGEKYKIVDIGMRMLAPEELYKAQGFPDDYIYQHDANGKPVTKTKQVAMCGNSVSPPVMEALVRANMVDNQQIQQGNVIREGVAA